MRHLFACEQTSIWATTDNGDAQTSSLQHTVSFDNNTPYVKENYHASR